MPQTDGWVVSGSQSLLGTSEGAGHNAGWGRRGHRTLGGPGGTRVSSGVGRGRPVRGMGSQAPAEPLTFEPEICLVISWCHCQGQILC